MINQNLRDKSIKIFECEIVSKKVDSTNQVRIGLLFARRPLLCPPCLPCLDLK